MRVANFPENEAARVATLHSLNILDTPRDDRFDRYTRITARIFDMPIVLISLVDRHRQWFKSAEGLAADQTPRDMSFCGHAILGDDVFEIRNARRDARFRGYRTAAYPLLRGRSTRGSERPQTGNSLYYRQSSTSAY